VSFGFNLGTINSASTGLSYVSEFTYSGGYTIVEYTAPAFAYVTEVRVALLPARDMPANVVTQFPEVSTAFSTDTKTISATLSGGNTTMVVLVFVR